MSCPFSFTLSVDSSGIKCAGQEHLNHLIVTTKEDYCAVEVDKTEELYCGIDLSWNYAKGYFNIAMPSYLKT